MLKRQKKKEDAFIPSFADFVANGYRLTALGSASSRLYSVGEGEIVPSPPGGSCIEILHDGGDYSHLDAIVYLYTWAVAVKLLIETDEEELFRVSGNDGTIVKHKLIA